MINNFFIIKNILEKVVYSKKVFIKTLDETIADT